MRSVETEGSSIDEAISRALHALGAPRERVEIEILENARRGVLGIGRKTARVRATMRAPMSWIDVSEPVERSVDADARDAAAGSRVEPSPAAALSEILRLMGAVATVTESVGGDGEATLVVSGADTSEVVGRHGEVLDALEYLVNRIGERRGPDAPRVSLDAEGYRERRRTSLEALARRAAEKARRTRKAVTLSPMNPGDRRAVHVALKRENGVSARSLGQGFYRKVIVIPEGARRSGGKPKR